MKKSMTRTTIIIVILIMAMVGYYAYLSNRSQADRAEANMTVVQSTLSRDLSKDYPPTPREVIKYYNEILRCLYNEESTDEEIEALGLKSRELYDDELLENNELGIYLIRLQADVATYRENGRRISYSNVASSINVDEFKKNGFSFAKLMCDYAIVQGNRSYTTSQMYLLRKDSDRKWKIYGWEDVENLKEQDE